MDHNGHSQKRKFSHYVQSSILVCTMFAQSVHSACSPARCIVVQAINHGAVSIHQNPPAIAALLVCLHTDAEQEHHTPVPAIIKGDVELSTCSLKERGRGDEESIRTWSWWLLNSLQLTLRDFTRLTQASQPDQSQPSILHRTVQSLQNRAQTISDGVQNLRLQITGQTTNANRGTYARLAANEPIEEHEPNPAK